MVFRIINDRGKTVLDFLRKTPCSRSISWTNHVSVDAIEYGERQNKMMTFAKTNNDSLIMISWEMTKSDIKAGVEMPNGSLVHFESILEKLKTLASQTDVSLPAAPVMSSEALVPVVPVENSIMPDRIICLEDGTEHVMMARYLKRRFGMSPDAYRRKWGLPSDYPMASPQYSAAKSRKAREIGLGTAEARLRDGRPVLKAIKGGLSE